jgi:hypothetical protein
LKEDFAILLYFGPPSYCGWRGTGVIGPILWWGILAVFAVSSEYRPGPNHDELKSRPIAFGIALVAFVAIYFVARWLSPN